jgi:hypothetical protein
MISGHIAPLWSDEYRSLPYIEEIIKQPDIQQSWLDAGHSAKNLIIETYSQPQPMPEWVSTLNCHWPEYKNFGYSFHKFVPGRYLPEHKDAYRKYKEKFNVDITEVVRILIYLEDWQPGQFNTVNTNVTGNWRAGDWLAWSGEAVHSVVNFGMHTRYALAITCHQ